MMVYYVVNALTIALNGALVMGFFMVLNMGVPVVVEIHRRLPFLREDEVIPVLVVAVMGLFVAVGLSPMVDMVMRYVKGYRVMLRDEQDKFDPAFRDVLDRMSSDENLVSRGTDKYSVYVMDDKEITSDHLGVNSFAVSRMLLKELTPDEVKAAVAHELAHLSLGHGVHVRVFFAVNVMGQLALWLTKRVLVFFKNVYGLELPVVSSLGVFGYGLFNVARMGIEVLLVLPLLIGAIIGFRQNEYAADRFVVGLGYGEGLHSFLLKRLDDRVVGTEKDGRFVRWIKSLIWPGPGKRLVVIEKVVMGNE